MRVAFVTWDGGGNRQPFEVLGKALADRGDDLHVLSHDSHQGIFEGIATFHALPEAVVNPHPPGERHPDSESYQRVMALLRSPELIETALGLLSSTRFDLAGIDMSLTSVLSVAEATRTPVAVIHHTLPGTVWSSRRSQLDASIGGVNKGRQRLGLEPLDSYGDLMATAEAHLAPTAAILDEPLPWELPMHYLGPLQPAGDAPVPDLPARFVLVSLSTTWQDQLDLLQQIIDSLSMLDRNVVVTTGPSITPSELRPGTNTVIVDHVPHLKVLDRVDAVVTHAGHGTVLSTLTAGVPLVCVPMGRDQHEVTRRVVALDAGIEVDPTRVADELLAAVRRVLEDASFRESSRRVARSITTHGGVTEALAILDRCAIDSAG